MEKRRKLHLQNAIVQPKECFIMFKVVGCTVAAAVFGFLQCSPILPFLLLATIDTVIVFLYIYIHLFPDCVMVALQILVLTVGVRILLGELKLNRLRFSFFLCVCRIKSGNDILWLLRISV